MTTWQEWAARSDTRKIYLVELTALKVADLSALSLYLANHPFSTDKFYIPCVSSLPRLTRTSNDTLDFNHMPSWGELEILIEPDYKPDTGRTKSWNELLSPAYNFLGQPLTIKLGGDDFAYEDFKTVFTGRIGGVKWTDNLVTFTIYDKSQDLAKKVPDYEMPESPRVTENSWDQIVPLVVGSVKNYKPVLINTNLPGSYPNKYALAVHAINALLRVYLNGIEYGSPAQWIWTQMDLSPARKDGEGSAIMDTFGPYAGSLFKADWLVQIDSIGALNSQGNSGPEVGLATFRWSMDGGLTWMEEGLLTWKLGYDSTTLVKAPAVGAGVLAVSGDYTGDCKLTYKAKIIRAGDIGDATCPQFIWSDDGGITWHSAVDILDTNPIALNRSLSISFSGVGVTTNYWNWVPITTAPGACSVVDGNPLDVSISISAGGACGVATFNWVIGGNSGSGITSSSPQEIFPGYSIVFTAPGLPGIDDYETGDASLSGSYYTPAFVIDDAWTWSFKQIPIPLANGASVQFTTQEGQDFYLWDEWRFILLSTLSVAGVMETTDVTVDAQGLISPATDAYADTAGEMIRALCLLFAGWNGAADFDTTALAAFKAAIPYEMGLVISSPTAISQIIDDLLTGIPAIYTIKLDGKFFVAEKVAPAGDPVLELTDVEFLSPIPEGAVDDKNWYRRVYLHYDRNWNTNQNASGVTQERLEWLRQEWRQISRRDEDVLLVYPWALDLGPLDTALAQRSEARELVDKLLALYKVRHETLKAVIKIAPFRLDLGKQVLVKRDKFSLGAGALFAVVGLELDFSANEATLTLWR